MVEDRGFLWTRRINILEAVQAKRLRGLFYSPAADSRGNRATTVVIKEIERNNGDYVVTIDCPEARDYDGGGQKSMSHASSILGNDIRSCTNVESRGWWGTMKNEEKTSGGSSRVVVGNRCQTRNDFVNRELVGEQASLSYVIPVINVRRKSESFAVFRNRLLRVEKQKLSRERERALATSE